MIWKALKKLALFAFSVALVLIVSTGVSKAASTSDLTFTLNDDGQSCSVTSCKLSASGELVIPATYNGKPVTSIGYGAFSLCDSLTAVTIPDSVTTIGRSAFSSCDSLTSVTIPDSVTTIGEKAFYYCESLTAVTIPDSVTTIGEYAFYYCSKLTSVIIGNGVTSVGGWAFGYTSKLANVYITDPSNWCKIAFENAASYPTYYGGRLYVLDEDFCVIRKIVLDDTVTVIPNYAFDGCVDLTSVTIGKNVSVIKDYAFNGCSNVTEITFTGDAPQIAANAFGGVTAMAGYPAINEAWTEEVRQNYGGNITWVAMDNGTCGENLTWVLDNTGTLTISGTGSMEDYAYTAIPWHPYRDTIKNLIISDGVTAIGKNAFAGCANITSVVIPDGVTIIGESAFDSCHKLASVTIPDSMTTIGIYAFSFCDNLTSVTIPESVTNIDYLSFYYCTALTEIEFLGNAPKIKSGAFSGVTATAYYPARNDNWTEEVRQNYGGTITWVAKEEADSRLTFTLNADGESYSVTSCDESASGEIVIPATYNRKPVTTIGIGAFEYCSSLTRVTIPDSVTTIGDFVFYNCTSLTAVTIPDSVTAIGDSAFRSCTSLTSVTIPDSVTTIGYMAFCSCDSLTAVTIGNSVTSIGSYAFTHCESLTAVTIGNSVTSIGSYAFSWCSSLTSITIPDSFTGIGDHAFCDCSSLTSITIGNGVTSIDDFAFYNCTSLTSVTIGDSVTSVGDYAFYKCTSLTSITIGNGVTSIGSWAFGSCSSLTDITIPDSVTSIGESAFYNCSLTSVTIPDSVTSIGDYAFFYCSSLKHVAYGGTQSQWNSIYIYSENKELTGATRHYEASADTIYYVENCINAGLFCSICNDFITRESETDGSHTVRTLPATVTCTQAGLTEGKVCEICGLVLVAQEEVAALGHIFVDDTCENCGATKLSVTIPGVEGTFTSFADVIAAYDPATQYIQLTGDVAVDLTLTKDLKIDLNGFTLSGVIELNGNAVYGVDTSTDGYSAANAGYFNCVDEKGDPVAPAAHFKTDKATYGAIKRYLAVQDENGWSFHRFYFGITHATLNTANSGIGYKAAFAGDEMVKAALGVKGAYGIELAVNEDFSACVTTRFAAFEFPNAGVAQSRTLLLQNILASGMSLEEMSANAAMPVYARTFLKLEDGTEIYSSVFQISLKELVQAADKNFAKLTFGQQRNLKVFYATYADLFKDWELGNL